MCYSALSRASKIENCRFIGKWSLQTLNMNASKQTGEKKLMSFYMHKEWKRQLSSALLRPKTNIEISLLSDYGKGIDFVDKIITQELEYYM